MYRTEQPEYATLDFVLRVVRNRLPTRAPTTTEMFVRMAAVAWQDMIDSRRQMALENLWEVMSSGRHVRLQVVDGLLYAVCHPPYLPENYELDGPLPAMHDPFFKCQLVNAMRLLWGFDWQHCQLIMDERYHRHYDEDVLLYDLYTDAMPAPPAFDATYAAQWYANDCNVPNKASKDGVLPLFA